MNREERIRAALSAALQPAEIAVADESHLHEGHAGARPEGETHYRVEIVSPAFEGRNRVQRQRMVHGLLGSEFEGGLHALSLTTLTPAEAQARRPARQP
jgi:BolA family transcriptional regulator, general stress-responsive regulator